MGWHDLPIHLGTTEKLLFYAVLMNKRKIKIIGIPMDLGQEIRGVDMGAGAVRYANLTGRLRHMGHEVVDSGNIEIAVKDSLIDSSQRTLINAVAEVSERIYSNAKTAVEDGYLPVFLGGDHAVAIGTIGGITHEADCGVIWVDAHGDFNTPESSPSGNIHGMPLAVLTGEGYPELVNVGRNGSKIKPENVVMIGLRDLDETEKNRLRSSGMKLYSMRDIDEKGMAAIAKESLRSLSHLKRVHVSLDIDGLDPASSPGVGTPVGGGISIREAHLLMEIIADSGLLSSVDVVEVNPMLDQFNQTGKTAADLVLSLMGKSIL